MTLAALDLSRLLVFGLVCGGGMAGAMYLMDRMGRPGSRQPAARPEPPQPDAQVAELRDEVTRLRAEVRRQDDERPEGARPD